MATSERCLGGPSADAQRRSLERGLDGQVSGTYCSLSVVYPLHTPAAQQRHFTHTLTPYL